MALKILFVTPYVPSIVRFRPFALIRELAKHGHQINLICLVQPSWEETYLNDISHYCENIYPVYLNRYDPYIHALTSLPTRVPLSVAYCKSADLKKVVKNHITQKSYDLIHTEFIRAAPATFDILGLPKVFDAVDSLVLAYKRSLISSHVSLIQRMIALIEWLKMQKYEPWVMRHFDRLIVSSPIDRNYMRERGNLVEVIPNGVDIDYFSYSPEPRQASTIVFLGKMSYYINVASIMWFYKEIFPLVRRSHPNVNLQIVGRNPTPAIISLGKDPAIEVTGTVSDVRPYLKKASLSICPMVSGAGIQFKILESMAVGTPCVTTRLACMSLETISDQEVLVADSPNEFAAAVCTLLERPQLGRSLGECGRKYVEKHHDWHKIGNQLINVYSNLV